MIETPPSFAIAPDKGHDVLAESLRAVRLTGSVFLDACFTAPFGIISPKRFGLMMPNGAVKQASRNTEPVRRTARSDSASTS